MEELLYEIHGSKASWELEVAWKSVGFVVHRFGIGTDGTQLSVVLDIDWKSRPIVVHADLMKSLCLTEMTCKGMVM